MANTTIQLKYSVVTSNAPTALANGELAINAADGKLFYSTPGGTIQSIVTYPGPAGLNKEVQFNDAGTAGANSNFTFDKSSASLNVTNLNVTTRITTGSGTGGVISGATTIYANNIIANTGGYVQFPDGTKQYTANSFNGLANVGATITVNSAANFYITNAAEAISNTTGALIVVGGIGAKGNIYGANAVFQNDIVAGAKDGVPLGGATNPIFTAIGNTDYYIQSYQINYANTANASSDYVLYPNNGQDANGWIDLGITSNAYACTAYSITGRNEGYLFMSAPAASGTSGNLVIATDSTGLYNSIEFVVGGFNKGKTNSNVKITTGTTSTTNTTGSLQVVGGIGVKGNVVADGAYIGVDKVATMPDVLAIAIALG